MILQALYDYYKCKADQLVPFGMDRIGLSFIIIIDGDGKVVRIENTQEDNVAKNFIVVKLNGRTGSKKVPNMFWDNLEYTIGYNKQEMNLSKIQQDIDKGVILDDKTIKEKKTIESDIQKTKEKNKTFIDLTNEYKRKYPDDKDFNALNNFYKNHFSEIRENDMWESLIKKPTVNISFRIEGSDHIIAENEALKPTGESDEECNKGICLITGKYGPLVNTNTATPIRDSASTAKLVAFQVNSGYDSYYKRQGNNAPISVEGESGYTTALNYLLRRESHNKFVIGNRTFVFWAIPKDRSDDDTKFESLFSSFFNINVNENDQDHNVEAIRDLLLSPYTGWLNDEGEDVFYILGLAPNKARISVEYFQKGKVSDFANNLRQHFNDLRIVGDDKPDYDKLNRLSSLLLAVTLQYKMSNVQPNLPESLMNSILNNKPYPQTFHQSCMRRIKAEQSITIRRAAILKACLNRKIRINNYNNQNEIAMALDKENHNQGYLCGRLFAILERVQEKAMGSSSLRERYLNSASTTPIAVFGRILNLSVYHLGKINDKGFKIYFEKLIGEIMDKVNSNGMPSTLDLDDQSRFMIGYYQQRQDFYKKKEEESGSSDTEE